MKFEGKEVMITFFGYTCMSYKKCEDCPLLNKDKNECNVYSKTVFDAINKKEKNEEAYYGLEREKNPGERLSIQTIAKMVVDDYLKEKNEDV